jgi:hypothetical protein
MQKKAPADSRRRAPGPRPEDVLPYVFWFSGLDAEAFSDVLWTAFGLGLEWNESDQGVAVTVRSAREAFKLGCQLGLGFQECRRRRQRVLKDKRFSLPAEKRAVLKNLGRV